MVNKENITVIVYKVVDELNELLPPEKQLNKSLEEELIGDESKLDSLGLVNLMVATEQKIEEFFGVYLNLANEDFFSMEDSPFTNIRTFVEYIYMLFEERTDEQ